MYGARLLGIRNAGRSHLALADQRDFDYARIFDGLSWHVDSKVGLEGGG